VTGQQIAQSIGPRLAKSALAIGVNGETRDLSRAIDTNASVRVYTWDDDEGKRAYWHSSAHLMAEAVEALYPGTKFGVGPAIDAGFYYDLDMGDHSLTAEDLGKIEKKMHELAERDVPYRREVKQWDDAVAYFRTKGDEYKLELLDGLKDEQITFYHQGNFTDLCSGPHVPSTGRI
jgi:threonyl-tRNA synthetase